MSLDLVKAIKSPFSTKGWFKKALIGGILLCLPIVNAAVFGAYVNYIRNLLSGNEAPPDFSDFGSNFVIGMKFFVGNLLLSIPFMLIFVIAVLGLGTTLSPETLVSQPVQFGFQIVSIMVGFIFYVMTLCFSVDKKMVSMIDFSRAGKFIEGNTKNFVMFIVFSILISVIFMILNTVLMITLVGILLLPITIFCSMMAQYNLVGQFGKSSPKLNEIIQ